MKQSSSKNPPQLIKDLIDLAKETRLYILKRNGPTSLKYCDEDGNKFKVELSTVMSCSCNQSKKHCIHTIHALLKVFQVDEKSPILWQNQYSQYDITNILNGQYKAKSEQSNKNTSRSIIHQMHQQQQQSQIENEDDQQQNRQAVTNDDMCPICQETLVCNEALVYCKNQCGNNFHAKCMKVWVIQKQSAGKKKIDCPMCRVDWGDTALVQIRQEEKNFEVQHKTHKKVCGLCKISPIIGGLFTCIKCPNYHLCEKCHYKNGHPHKVFVAKKSNLEEYQFVSESYNSLVYAFPDNLNVNNGDTGGLMLIGAGFQKQNKCQFCYKQKQLRLLACGHIADEQCINRMKLHCYICPIDQQPQFMGLFNTLNKEQRTNHLNETKKWVIQKEDEYNMQNNKLPPIGQAKNRQKQLSQRHFETRSIKVGSTRTTSTKRQLSAQRQQFENPLQIKSVKSQAENIF